MSLFSEETMSSEISMIVSDTRMDWKRMLADCLYSYCMPHEHFNKRLRNSKNEKLPSSCLVTIITESALLHCQ